MLKVAVIVLAIPSLLVLHAQDKPKELLAAAISVSGECFYERKGESHPVKPKTIFFRNDRLYTKTGKMTVQVGPSAVLHLPPFSAVQLNDLVEQNGQSNVVVQLESGTSYTKFVKKLGHGSQYVVRSPTLVASVRGTEFVVSTGGVAEATEDSDIPQGVFVNSGAVAVSPANREDDVTELYAGEQITSVDNALVKGVMEDFMKRKMRLFRQLQAMREEQYRILEREKARQLELLEKARNADNLQKIREKNQQLFNK
ncbi:MAG: FecR domain-containing protein [Turneriella sp.]|nr:FecR domain-containing protein [Turneriella sp.]